MRLDSPIGLLSPYWEGLGAPVKAAYLQFQLETECHVPRCSEEEKLKEENSGIQDQE